MSCRVAFVTGSVFLNFSIRPAEVSSIQLADPRKTWRKPIRGFVEPIKRLVKLSKDFRIYVFRSVHFAARWRITKIRNASFVEFRSEIVVAKKRKEIV